MIDCTQELVMPSDNTPVEGTCMHIAGNPLCPGTKNIHKPVHQCYPEQSWNVACGPTQVPADTVSQWSACDPATPNRAGTSHADLLKSQLTPSASGPPAILPLASRLESSATFAPVFLRSRRRLA